MFNTIVEKDAVINFDKSYIKKTVFVAATPARLQKMAELPGLEMEMKANFSDDVDLNGRGNSLLPRLCSMDVEMMSPGIPLLQTLLYFEADHDFFERHREFLLKLCAAVSRINYDPVPTMRSS
ncbi:hypothetical protein Y032_0109g84 [Ancylostoma ceylanicum]|uniref:Uncharacterized protein n=1 Tax=Ancylostoma ceylanicum TaxID=53326 RepID=A0A016TF36_9BILA|nr:hypothetical protein Y032_0109g84 [Ancylostoma ceylanicum]